LNSKEYSEAINKVKARQTAAILDVRVNIPSADARPPDRTLFVCKLSPTTTDDGLKVFFSRFGEVLSVDLIRDKVTQNSLCYALVVSQRRLRRNTHSCQCSRQSSMGARFWLISVSLEVMQIDRWVVICLSAFCQQNRNDDQLVSWR
jgi:hypothetical protein